MATVQVNNLDPVGSELFSDSESYLNALSEAEMVTRGGVNNTSISSEICDFITYIATKL